MPEFSTSPPPDASAVSVHKTEYMSSGLQLSPNNGSTVLPFTLPKLWEGTPAPPLSLCSDSGGRPLARFSSKTLYGARAVRCGCPLIAWVFSPMGGKDGGAVEARSTHRGKLGGKSAKYKCGASLFPTEGGHRLTQEDPPGRPSQSLLVPSSSAASSTEQCNCRQVVVALLWTTGQLHHHFEAVLGVLHPFWAEIRDAASPSTPISSSQP